MQVRQAASLDSSDTPYRVSGRAEWLARAMLGAGTRNVPWRRRRSRRAPRLEERATRIIASGPCTGWALSCEARDRLWLGGST